jgi:copper chaperone CopZ
MSVRSTYQVTGMTCDHCVNHVTEALTALPGVERVQVDLPSGRVDVNSTEALDPAAVARAVDAAGYALADA